MRLLLLFLALFTASTVAAPRPNIILIMADDLGYETMGANGGTSYRTPVLDRLAATGARFTQCHAQPLCTPTRAQLMTGQSNIRNYIKFGNMDPRSVTFGNLFKNAGYATAIAGKWQLGRDVDLPKKFGFDQSYLWQHTRRPPRFANPGLEINGVPRDYNHGEYGPKIINDLALEFIEQNQSRPFFLYYPMILTHAPYQPTPDSRDWDPKAIGEKVNQRPAHFGDMVEYMDKMIGRLIARLDELKLRDQTLVIFLGDNGTGRGTVSMMGDRKVTGGKGRTTFAGTHVPLIANWLGRVAPGQVHTNLVDTTDFLPTICAAADIPVPQNLKIDGRSFLPQLIGQPGQPRDWIYAWYSPRQGTNTTIHEYAFNHHYKLYRDGRFYDLTADRDEAQPLPKASLAGNAAASLRQLQSALDQFKDARPSHL